MLRGKEVQKFIDTLAENGDFYGLQERLQSESNDHDGNSTFLKLIITTAALLSSKLAIVTAIP